MRPTTLAQNFLDHTPIHGVEYEHNDFVRIVKGAYAGKSGSLVSVLGLEPEPQFVLELESGFDVEVFQSELAHFES